MAKKAQTTATAVAPAVQVELDEVSTSAFKELVKQTAGLTLAEHTEIMHGVQQAAFFTLGAHMYSVQFHQKYKDAFGTLEEWAESEFGLTRQRIYEYIDGFKIVSQLATRNPKFLPRNDYQARQLKGLEMESMHEAWFAVIDNVDSPKQVTAAGIRRIADQYKKEDAAFARDEKKTKTKELADDAEIFDPNEPAFDVPRTPIEEFHGDGTTRLGPKLPVTYIAEDPAVLIYASRLMKILEDDNQLDPNLIKDIAMKLIELASEL